MSTTKVFLTGASGYIGGSVLHALLESPNASKYSISALVRSEDHINKVEALGVRPVKGSLQDFDILEKEAYGADIVIHAASSQLVEPAKVIAAGCEKRKAEGKEAYLIHTSGSSSLADNSRGEFLSKIIYLDTDDVYSFEKAAPSYVVRDVDIALVDAAENGSFGLGIIVAPTIYGSGTGPVKRTTHQVRMMVEASIKSRQARYIGAGLSAWSHVHIEDLANLYVLLTDAVREGKDLSGKRYHLFAEAGEHTWKDLAKAIAINLHSRGLADSREPVPWESDEEAADALIWGLGMYLHYAFSSNSRIRGVRSRELGWKPLHSDEDFLRSMDTQVAFLTEEEKLLDE